MRAGPQHRRRRQHVRDLAAGLRAARATTSRRDRPRRTADVRARRRAAVVARAVRPPAPGSLRRLCAAARGCVARRRRRARPRPPGRARRRRRWPSGTRTPRRRDPAQRRRSVGGLAGPVSRLSSGSWPGGPTSCGASTTSSAEARRLGARDARLAPVPSPRGPGARGRAADRRERRRTGRRPVAGERDRRRRTRSLRSSYRRPARPAEGPRHPRRRRRASCSTGRLHVAAVVVVGGGDADLLSGCSCGVASSGSAGALRRAPQDDVPTCSRAADVVRARPATGRRAALVVQEAHGTPGAPVVATDTGGLRDLVAASAARAGGRPTRPWPPRCERYLDRPEPPGIPPPWRVGERATSWDDGKATASRWHEWYSALPGMT